MNEKNEDFIELIWEITNLTGLLNEYVSYVISDGENYYNIAALIKIISEKSIKLSKISADISDELYLKRNSDLYL